MERVGIDAREGWRKIGKGRRAFAVRAAAFRRAYLGICAPHVWIYCVAHRAGLDWRRGIGIPLYIALSAFMLAVMPLA
ncbi:MAG: hypothetical protein ACLSVD_07065 [Eggerthellaceae bacterium]